MTLDLEAIKARCAAATEPPWDTEPDPIDSRVHVITETVWIAHGCYERVDAEFIAHARSDVPALVVEVERLQAERDNWEDRYWTLLAEIGGTGPG